MSANAWRACGTLDGNGSYRRGVIAAAILINTLSMASCSSEEGFAATGPANLIVISIDTLRADHVGAYGYPRPTTPNIDALARDSVLFDKCVAHAATTLASHASIFTSLLPRHHGASISRTTRLAEGVTTLAEALRGHGYSTASFNGGIQLDRIYGLNRGFDIYESVQPQETEPQTLAGDENRLIKSVERGLSWMRKARQPFFLFLHSYEIHHPYTPDEKTLQLFDGDYSGPLADDISVETLTRINTGKLRIDRSDLQHIISTYDAELRSADAAVGRLISSLREDDLYDDTMIVVTSDYGEEFGEHERIGWHGHSLYDELLLVPLIVKFPQSRFAGRVVNGQVRGIDIAPTALAALGIEIPDRFAGDDLTSDIAKGEQPEHLALSMFDTTDDYLLWSLRSDRWKLHQWNRGKLINLFRDPAETKNLAVEESWRVAHLRRNAERLMNARDNPEDIAVRPRAETEEQLRALGYVE